VATTITLTHGRRSATLSRKTKKPEGEAQIEHRKAAGRAAGKPADAARALRLAARLAAIYRAPRITLDFATPWQCLAATILSAQCTDERVNRITPRLFAAFPDAAATAAAAPGAIEEIIRSAGFYHEKARALIAAAKTIVEQFDGRVPSTMAHLLTLAGVGRKTANVLLGHVFKQPAIAVDTHVRRVAYRLGLTQQADPDKIERDIARLLPPDSWTKFSMRLILHGRKICRARQPQCARCPLLEMCPRQGLPVSPQRARMPTA
jgi:endonuclease-3